MVTNGIPEFNVNDLTDFDNNDYCGSDFGFDRFNYQTDLSNVAGPSQVSAGADVCGELDNYPAFLPSPTEPESLYLDYGVYPREGHSLPSSQGMGVPTVSPQSATLPLPTLCVDPFSPMPTPSYTLSSLSPDLYTAPMTTHAPAEGFRLPDAHPPPSYEELWHQYNRHGLLSNSLYPDIPSIEQVTAVAPPETPLPALIASSSGPQRTRQSARDARRYDPAKRGKKTPDADIEDWNQTLVRFRTNFDGEFNTPYSVHNGQPSGGLVPEEALASISEFVKEDLKRSPLRATKAGEGKRSRDVEKYLEGLLQAIRPAVPTSIPGGGSGENDTTAAILSRLANELETRLVAVNQQPALRQLTGVPEVGEKKGRKQSDKQAKRSRAEQRRREKERRHLERISRLFRVPAEPWLKRDVLSLAVLFLLYGPAPFPPDFLEVPPEP